MMAAVIRALRVWREQGVADFALVLGARRAAMAAYRRLLEHQPENGYARMVLGNLLAEQGEPAAAAEQFRRVLESDECNADAWFNLGFLAEQGGALDEAERCMRRALALAPRLDRAWYGLGLVLVRRGRLDEAAPAFQRNIELQPFSPYGYCQLARVWRRLGSDERAWRVQRQLARFEPAHAGTLAAELGGAGPADALGPSSGPV